MANPRTKELGRQQSSAYHEAGHAVVAYSLHISLGRKGVTIVPDFESHFLGSTHIVLRLRANPEYATSARVHVLIENYAVMCIAGDEAERKFSSRRTFGGQRDLQNAVELLDYISGSSEIANARLRVAQLQARSRINNFWEPIVAVATKLLESPNGTLTPKQVREVIRTAIAERTGLPQTALKIGS